MIDNFTRPTSDAIALCAMGYCSNSFYSDAMHSFVETITITSFSLEINGDRAAKSLVAQLFCVAENHRY